MGKFLGIRIPVTNTTKPPGIKVKHVNPQFGAVADHTHCYFFVDLHAPAPTIVDHQWIVGVIPGHSVAENRANPASKNISRFIRTATEATQKDRWRLKDLSRPETCAEWTWIGVQANLPLKRILFARQ